MLGCGGCGSKKVQRGCAHLASLGVRSPSCAERHDYDPVSLSFYYCLSSRYRPVSHPIARVNSNARGYPGINVWNIDRPKWRRLGYEPRRHRITGFEFNPSKIGAAPLRLGAFAWLVSLGLSGIFYRFALFGRAGAHTFARRDCAADDRIRHAHPNSPRNPRSR